MIINYKDQRYSKIGEAYLIENEIGIFVKSYKYNANEEVLNDIIYSNQSVEEERENCYSLTLTGDGHNKEVYKDEGEVEFAFLTRSINADVDVDAIIRDIKISSVITDETICSNSMDRME